MLSWSDSRLPLEAILCLSGAHVKMEIPALVPSLKSSNLISTSFQLDNTFYIYE